MKPEINLSKDQVENFSIDVLKNYEGCVDALVYMKNKYGDKTMDLRTKKNDFKKLVKEGKEIWVINFLLNTITKPYRAIFIQQFISEFLHLIPNEEISNLIKDFILKTEDFILYPKYENQKYLNDIYKDIFSYRENHIKSQLKAIGASAVSTSHLYFEKLQVQSQLLKAILFHFQDIIQKGNLTRSSVKFSQSLSESLQWLYISNQSDDIHIDQSNLTLKHISNHLIDFVGYFVDTEEKEF
jgi:hypothetical protein